MEIYSYIEGIKEQKKSDEVALIVNFDELLKFKEFIDFCIEGMKTNDKFSHEHFSDFLQYKKQYKAKNNVDVIISKKYNV
ncbi:MAG: hypothetical protein LBG21_04800 [Campylobacteraceae bacterium]|jgi:hypothetical protein|nr:hypothetical protein [Campylobacteraceae bacterium]